MRFGHARLEDDEAARLLALERVLHADDRAFRDGGMGEHFLHAARRQSMSGDIDNAIGAAHDVEIAVFVLKSGVGSLVEARKIREITFSHSIVMAPTSENCRAAGAA